MSYNYASCYAPRQLAPPDAYLPPETRRNIIMTAKLPKAHKWQSNQLRRATVAAGVSLWAWNVDTDAFTMDAIGFKLWGLPPRGLVTFEKLSSRIHPADRDRVRSAFTATRSILGTYETDFRILLGDEVRWIAARGQREDDGIVGRTMFGIFLDVTGRKQAEEGHELLAGEMSHRVKNLLTIATGLTAISSRTAASTEEMAHELTERLCALGRAHDLVRPLPDGQGNAALLGDLLAVLLAPYDDLGAFKGRIRVAVERMGVGETAATSIALIIHELATNSMKYGALSIPNGTLDVSSTSDEKDILICWLEFGGPEVHQPEGLGGFGSKLVKRSVAALHGNIDYEWPETGLVVRLRLDRSKLSV